MDDLPKNMTKRRDVSKHLWHGESACPHAAGTGRARVTRERHYIGRRNWDSLAPAAGACHETSSPEFPKTRRGRCRHAGLATMGIRARLSDAADADRRRLRGRRRRRHHGAPDRPVARRPPGAVRAAVNCKPLTPSGRWSASRRCNRTVPVRRSRRSPRTKSSSDGDIRRGRGCWRCALRARGLRTP